MAAIRSLASKQSILHLISLITADWLTHIDPTLTTPMISSYPSLAPLHASILHIHIYTYM